MVQLSPLIPNSTKTSPLRLHHNSPYSSQGGPSFMTDPAGQRSLPENAYKPLPPGATYKPIIPATEAPPELTARSIGWGVFFCVIFTVASAYSALKVGQSMEAAIPISILAIGLARLYKRRSTLLENVIITGIGGVSGAAVAGAIFTIPALYILKLDPNPIQTIFICLSGGCLGVLFLIPLRRYFVREMHGELPFPEATAITEVLVTGEKGGSQAKLLLQATAMPTAGSLAKSFSEVEFYIKQLSTDRINSRSRSERSSHFASDSFVYCLRHPHNRSNMAYNNKYRNARRHSQPH